MADLGNKLTVENLLKIKKEEKEYFIHPNTWQGAVLVYRIEDRFIVFEIGDECSKPQYCNTYSLASIKEIVNDATEKWT